MTLPMPTVEALVQVFKDRNWIPTRRFGARHKNVVKGDCCAIPALVALADPEAFEEFLENPREGGLYEMVRTLYGRQAEDVWMGFDFGARTSKWRKLGADLREALENPKPKITGNS